jgi:hypothetical protein
MDDENWALSNLDDCNAIVSIGNSDGQFSLRVDAVMSMFCCTAKTTMMRSNNDFLLKAITQSF